jgi:hypothetical protein
MAIHRLLQNMPMTPEDIGRLAAAYEATLQMLELADRSDPLTQLVASKIIEIGQTGVRDPLQISAIAISAFAPQSRA